MKMYVLNLLKKYVVNSQIYVSFMGTALAVFFLLEQNAFRCPKVILIFLTFFSGYLYTKYQGHKKIFYKILIFNSITGVICIVLILKNHNYLVLIRWLIIVLLGIFYNSIFLNFFIRNIPLFKAFYVGIVWGLMVSFLGIPDFNFAIFSIVFLYISALVLPFDIRDLKRDEVLTFPKLIGIQNTKYLAYFLIFLSNIISIFNLKSNFALAFLLTSIISFVLIYFSDEDKSDVYFSFWIESCSGLMLIFYFVLYFL